MKSGDLIVGYIPEGYRPTDNFVSTSNVSNHEFVSLESSYLYLGTNGVLIVRNNQSTDYRNFHINETYIMGE